MKNEIFERNYEIKKENVEKSIAFFEMLKESGILKSISERFEAMTYIIVPEKKNFYEECLRILDGIAKRLGGKIRGFISYKDYDAQIHTTLPFFEFIGQEDIETLHFITSQASSVRFCPEDNGQIMLSVYIDCFESIENPNDVISEELAKSADVLNYIQKTKDEEIDEILSDPQIYNMIDKNATPLGITPKDYLKAFDCALHENPEAVFGAIDEEMKRKREENE